MIRVLKASSPVKYVAILCLMSISQAFASVSVPKIFGDHMVLQRNMPIPVWGQANPDEKVIVSLGKNSKTAYADKNDKWLVRLSPMEADGRSYVLTIKGENLIQYHDVLIGDVWVCGGQSNMQWQIHYTPFEEQDTTFIRNAQLRLFTVHIETDYVPKHDIDGSGWKTLSNETINQFSAVAYHFGKYVQDELEVPVGLISNNLGATSIETWMSYQALMGFPQFESEVEPFLKLNKSSDEINADFEKKKVLLDQNSYNGCYLLHNTCLLARDNNSRPYLIVHRQTSTSINENL